MKVDALKLPMFEMLIPLERYRDAYVRFRNQDPVGNDFGHAALADLVERLSRQARIVITRMRTEEESGQGERNHGGREDPGLRPARDHGFGGCAAFPPIGRRVMR